jgi:hypothetical protein
VLHVLEVAEEGEIQVNLWIKRAIGVAALGGGLLALGAGTASAKEVSADVSARVGRSTSAQVRVCADGRVLSRVLGSCGGQASSGRTSASVQVGRDSGGSGGSGGIRVRARVPRVASADVSIGTRRSRPSATASGQASVSRPARADTAADTSPRASADATASLSRPRARRLLDLRPVASLAGVGLLGSSPFTLVGDPAAGNLLPTGELTLADLTGEAPAGIGVLESGPIASGNQVAVDVGDVSPSVPVTVCGNGVGALGDSSASCGTGQQAGSGTGQPSGGDGSSTPGDGSGDGTAVGTEGVSASVPVTVCGNGVGLLGDTSATCSSDTSTGGIIAPPPGRSDTGTSGTVGTPGGGSTGTSGLPGGPAGLTPGAAGGAGDPIASFAPLRSSTGGPGALPFTGATSDLLAVVAAGLLTLGLLAVRATRPDAATRGGGDR